MTPRTSRAVACAGIALLAVFGLTACDDDDTPAEATPTVASQENSGTGSESGAQTDAEPEPTGSEAEEPDVDASEAAESDEDRRPAGLPEDLPRIGVPFYYPSELVASPSAGDPWVLEFVTDHELTIVNNTIANDFSESNGWHGLNREVTGQQTVTTGEKDGYLLVIAVAPEPSDDFKTSLYYTLSTR